MGPCPICGDALAAAPVTFAADLIGFSCRRCGEYQLAGPLIQSIKQLPMGQRAVLSHRLRCQQRPGQPVTLFESELDRFALGEPLPKPLEQIDRLVLWVGERQMSASHRVPTQISELSAWVGASITPDNPHADLSWLLQEPEARALLERGAGQFSDPTLRLTMNGWRRYEALKQAQVESHFAFMAMQFDKDLIRAVNQYFKPAVARAGFELKLLTDDQPAGLIDDQLRVALRTARFVIADLTHANNGAYWEAGFAEGLGRPVIYTCRQAEWDAVDERGRRKVHFDTSHLVTIIWSPDNLQDAADRLAATIRATLPSEATMMDPLG
ncbi:hypothetical protein UB44_23380 [Burkholderiaceae bacterium 26]|nr:hypothetical protein UB44_23380 [Burkholderiaceae bacterium 26]